MDDHHFVLSGSWSQADAVSAIAGEEAYGTLQLTRLGVGIGAEDNWADFEDVATMADEIEGELVPTDEALAQAIQQRTPAWRLVMVTIVFVEGVRQRIALFRKNP